jgi:hypothetical protein
MVESAGVDDIVIRIMQFMGTRGIRYLDTQVANAVEYVDKMVKDKRVILIEDDGFIHSVVFYSVCNDFEPFYKKEMWDFREHDPEGSTVYIEKAVCAKMKKSIATMIRNTIQAKYPKAKIGKWHRWGKRSDREFGTVRR